MMMTTQVTAWDLSVRLYSLLWYGSLCLVYSFCGGGGEYNKETLLRILFDLCDQSLCHRHDLIDKRRNLFYWHSRDDTIHKLEVTLDRFYDSLEEVRVVVFVIHPFFRPFDVCG